MNYSNLRTQILASMKYPPKITAQALQEQLINIVNGLDLGALLLGVATPSLAPNTEANGFYFGLQPGTYTNFPTINGETITVESSEVAIIVRSGNYWSKIHITTYPTIDPTTKHWMIGNEDTGVLAEGTDGVTPHIDPETGNWFIGTSNTGIHAQGAPGQDAYQPFKGTFASVSELNTAFPEPNEGDTAYVEDTVENTTVLKVYDVVNGEWHDTGTTADSPVFGSGQLLSSVKIDNTQLANPADGSLPKASDVMQLKAKLEGVTASETKVQLVETSGEGQNVYNGFINGDTGEYSQSDKNKFIVVPLNGAKSVRWLAKENASNPYYVGWAFGTFSGEIDATLSTFTARSKGVYANNPLENQAVEYVEKAPDDATHAVITIWIYKQDGNSAVTMNNFYCYLQSGTNVSEELAEKASYSDLEGLWRYQKNLLNNKDYITGEYYTFNNLTPTSNQNGVLSNKLLLEEGLTYTVSNIAANTGYKFFIAVIYNNNDEVVAAKGIYTVDLKHTGSSGYNSYGDCTFVAKKWHEDQAYIRLQLQFSTDLGVYNQAQLEVGNAVTDFAEYNSVKEFDIAKESDVKTLQQVTADNSDCINNIENHLYIKEYEVDLSNVELKAEIINTTLNPPQWKSTPSLRRSCIIQIAKDKGNIIRITPQEGKTITFAFLSEMPVLDTAVKYSTSYNLTTTYSTYEYEISQGDDLNYLYLMMVDQDGNDKTPTITYLTKKEFNFLAIGNSNDITALAYVPRLLQDILPDYHINFYFAYIGYGVLTDHLQMFDNDLPYGGDKTFTDSDGNEIEKTTNCYYWRNSVIYEIKKSGVTLKQLLKLHKWDVVKFITQGADVSAIVYERYERTEGSKYGSTTKEIVLNGRKKLLSILNTYLNYPFKVMTNISGLALRNTDSGRETYNNTYKEGYKRQREAIGIDFVSPDGIATLIARSNETLSEIGTVDYPNYIPLMFQNGHLNAGFPCLLTAYTAIECILRNLHINKSIYDKNLWIPTKDNAEGINAQASDEPYTAPADRKMTYGESLGIEEDGEIIQSNILAAKEIAVIANNIMPELAEDDYILPPSISKPTSESE